MEDVSFYSGSVCASHPEVLKEYFKIKHLEIKSMILIAFFYPWAFWKHTAESTKCPIFFDVRFLTLMHRGKTKRQKPNINMGKLGCF